MTMSMQRKERGTYVPKYFSALNWNSWSVISMSSCTLQYQQRLCSPTMKEPITTMNSNINFRMSWKYRRSPCIGLSVCCRALCDNRDLLCSKIYGLILNLFSKIRCKKIGNISSYCSIFIFFIVTNVDLCSETVTIQPVLAVKYINFNSIGLRALYVLQK